MSLVQVMSAETEAEVKKTLQQIQAMIIDVRTVLNDVQILLEQTKTNGLIIRTRP